MFKEGELHMQQYPVRTIDLEALRENVRLLRSTLPEKTKLMAVVKADAYGHGIAKVARAALEAGASALAVARTEEAQRTADAGRIQRLARQIRLFADRFGGSGFLFRFRHGISSPVTIYLPLDLWQPAIGMGHLVA